MYSLYVFLLYQGNRKYGSGLVMVYMVYVLAGTQTGCNFVFGFRYLVFRCSPPVVLSQPQSMHGGDSNFLY